MICVWCKSGEGVRLYTISIDGDPLRSGSFHLCNVHGDAFLIRVGAVIGELTKDATKGPR